MLKNIKQPLSVLFFAFVIFLSGLLNAGMSTIQKKPVTRNYFTFNFPSAVPGSKTLLTGIREVNNTENMVYISGFYKCPDETCVVPFVYRGLLQGNGSWHVLNYPSSNGVTVTSTNLYGPNNGPGNNIQVVGNYTTMEAGESTIGCLYEGPLDGTGAWTTLIPTSSSPVLNTIAHSTMGGLVVGNYDTQLDAGKAFIYDIRHKRYYEITKPMALSITAYGIWHNRDDSYTICGGYSNVNPSSGIDTGYLVDWNSKKHTLTNWRSFNFNNDPVTAIVTHFDGITSDGLGGYNLTGDWLGVSDTAELGFFAHVQGSQAQWSSITYPPRHITSGNSVYKKVVIGVYVTRGDSTVNGYISIP